MKHFFVVAILLPFCRAISDWRPFVQHSFFGGGGGAGSDGIKGPFSSQPSFSSLIAQSYQPNLNSGGQCQLYKVGFTQDLYFQYIQYKYSMPELKEFTLCFWTKFNNHSNDHPIFSYAVDGQPRAIVSWISNTERSSYFSLSVSGHTFYRLNYPLRLNRWYHTCQSWNGKTGEWQIWVDAERVGRGFHNRLVGHVIPSGGVAISGQEQSQIGGGFLEGDYAPKGAGGMLGELTMVQLYKVALTAGKAHRDHKHHHAHKFDHNGTPITTTPAPQPRPRPTLPTHPLLTGGQLNPNIAFNLASGQIPPTPQPPPQQQFSLPGVDFNSFLSGQFGNALQPRQMNSPQAIGPQQFLSQADDPTQQQQNSQFPLPSLPSGFGPQQQQQPQPNFGIDSFSSTIIGNNQNVQFLEPSQLDAHSLFKREHSHEATIEKPDDKEFGKKLTPKTKRETPKKLDPVHEDQQKVEGSKPRKRELIFSGGAIIDDGLFGSSFDRSLLSGLAGIGQNEPVLEKQRLYDEREPAEAEVMAVMNVCSGCEYEPFEKALIFGWRTVPKKLYSGAFYIPAVPNCKSF